MCGKTRESAHSSDQATPRLEYVSVAEAAALLGVHRSAVYQAITTGHLHTVRAMGKLALRRGDVEAYVPRRYRGKSG